LNYERSEAYRCSLLSKGQRKRSWRPKCPAGAKAHYDLKRSKPLLSMGASRVERSMASVDLIRVIAIYFSEGNPRQQLSQGPALCA
jgi:hypothetical protein